ncbi:uncharacterized protein MONOS_16268 [Monocercomonoides exilis]|uniref:uncharacterized protein n=1 Tax=Monocercomonoides exilis TaxID=2049356 RepID=UPI00355A4016|nr:hypothetical protein MONOS_16268 [Monocercomonoides exilis]|eukprot:MONOS_16268.1-p1 / transcript=MONOS_16268.1 / gene=MONOS_16268 / organism=Monocercomonoides_exilis_PA203 / gene_product=unspecified product / transcript_product=unspecified product / location=Mono_scaffold01600:3994-4573(-) / protein_length=115 / sequence_SO=supercontig / SO=protein_coding / is_pseudo=false
MFFRRPANIIWGAVFFWASGAAGGALPSASFCRASNVPQSQNVVCAEDTNAGESQGNACGGGVWVHRRSMHTRQKRHWIGGSASCPGTHNEANALMKIYVCAHNGRSWAEWRAG